MATPTLLKGSFRGVPFGTLSHSMEGGRRTVTHEFPGRDVPYVEDLGLKARSFSLDLFVLGDDVATQATALRSALEQAGPGVLVHPYLGSMSVQVNNFSFSESYDSQRLAKFSVGFLQPGKLEFPTAVVNPSGTASSASTSASLQAGANAASIDTSAAPAAAAMSSLVTSTTNLVQTAAKRAALPNGLGTRAETASAIALMSAYKSDSAGLSLLIATPDLMSYATADVIFRLASLGMTALQAFAQYKRLLSDAAVLFGSLHFDTTLIGIQMQSNAGLYRDVVYTAIVGSAASNAIDAQFVTYDQAIETRDALGAMFDIAMAEVLDTTLFGWLQDLRSSSLTNIPNPDQALPNVVEIRVSSSRPSLVLAHDLMSGSDDEQTVIDLNAVRNPWFAPNIGNQVRVLR